MSTHATAELQALFDSLPTSGLSRDDPAALVSAHENARLVLHAVREQAQRIHYGESERKTAILASLSAIENAIDMALAQGGQLVNTESPTASFNLIRARIAYLLSKMAP